ncbi:MAG: hypothetical protein NY202_05160 [Mollicutes bacterium UO1]
MITFIDSLAKSTAKAKEVPKKIIKAIIININVALENNPKVEKIFAFPRALVQEQV